MGNETIKNLLNQLAKNPNSALFAAIAEDLRKQGRYAQALEICQNGLKQNTRYANGFYTSGRIYYDLKQYTQAETAFDKTLTIDPDHIKALEFLIMTQIELKAWSQASQALDRLLLKNPLNTNTNKLLKLIAYHHQTSQTIHKKQALASGVTHNFSLKLRLRLKIIRLIRSNLVQMT
jgi:tetratricopeptide (TPR) repeat protein